MINIRLKKLRHRVLCVKIRTGSVYENVYPVRRVRTLRKDVRQHHALHLGMEIFKKLPYRTLFNPTFLIIVKFFKSCGPEIIV